MTAFAVASVAIKVVKLVLMIIILVLYRTGYSGQFLGVGGTWNLNEEKNVDAEILASGVFIGYFIYTLSTLITFCIKRGYKDVSANDVLMNIIGVFVWVAVAGTALHYWAGYQNEYKYRDVSSERECGLALGALCILTGAGHLIDAFVSFSLLNGKD